MKKYTKTFLWGTLFKARIFTFQKIFLKLTRLPQNIGTIQEETLFYRILHQKIQLILLQTYLEFYVFFSITHQCVQHYKFGVRL